MTRIQQIIAGLTIIAKYDGSDYSVAAEHDVLYAGGTLEDKITEEDKAAMLAAGWNVNTDVGGYQIFT